MKLMFRTLALTVGLLLLPGAVLGHVIIDPPEVLAGKSAVIALRVGHGCDHKATTALRVEAPPGLASLKPQPKAGWTLKVEHDKNGRAAVAIWSGGSLSDEDFDQFALLVKAPDTNGAVYFPTVQTCDGGEARWTDIPAAGQAWHDVPHPAPVLVLTGGASTKAVPAKAVTVSGGWSRATPPGARTGAGYITIANSTGVADKLVNASSPASASVEVHTMSMAGGVMSMRQISDGVAIPAGGKVAFAPGGLHLMLVGLRVPLKAGDKVALTLLFAKAGKVETSLAVQPLGAPAPSGAPEHNHMEMH